MPVSKYRSIEDATADEPDLVERGAPGLRRALALSELCRRLSRRRVPAGVFRFRSVDEARRHRESPDGDPRG